MKIVKDFWANPQFADLLFQMNDSIRTSRRVKAPPRTPSMR